MIKWTKTNGQEIETNDLEATVEYCESLGWKRSEQEERLPTDGDKGSGKPGTMEWHRHWINDLHDKAEIADYVRELTGEKLDLRGNLKAAKTRALKMIEEAQISMAETAQSVITSALQEIGVQAVEAPIEASEAQDAITYLNRMMTKFAAQGIALGYTIITNLGDTITVADGALEGIVKNLAITLNPQFGSPGTPINPLLVQQAREGIDSLRDIAVTITPTLFPGSLPIGSGNEGEDIQTADHFYVDPADGVLTEQGGFISVESETELP